MFEECYLPLPDRTAYLNRIGCTHTVCSEESLDALILAHQLSVPFEDIDSVLYKKPASCSIEDLFDKIVTKRRGGYCFEQNALFTSLLRSLGYKAWSGRGKVVRGKDLSKPILILHRVNFVELEDGIHFCDVGYGGPMPSFCLKLEDGYTKTANGETFNIRKYDERWWMVGRITSEGTQEDLLLVCTDPEENADFSILSYYASTNAASIFTQLLLVNRRLTNGNVSITGDTFTLREGNSVTEKKIQDDKQLSSVLKEYFGIVL